MGLFSSSEKYNSLECLFRDQLQDVYDAENQLLDALPRMAEAATAEDLKSAFRNHLTETEKQIERLEKGFGSMKEAPKRKTCDAMKGLLSEGNDAINAKGSDEVRDAALICAAQRVEHYEIAVYGCLRNLASHLGMDASIGLLQTTLDEEGAADKALTSLAETGINAAAAS